MNLETLITFKSKVGKVQCMWTVLQVNVVYSFPESSLYDEVRSLKDTNRALQLYLNKILMKIIDNESMQHVLSVDDIPATSNIHPPKQHDITIQPQSSTSTIPKVMRSSFSTGLLSKFLSKRLPLSQQTRDININVTEEAIPVNTVDDGKDVSCTR